MCNSDSKKIKLSEIQFRTALTVNSELTYHKMFSIAFYRFVPSYQCKLMQPAKTANFVFSRLAALSQVIQHWVSEVFVLPVCRMCIEWRAWLRNGGRCHRRSHGRYRFTPIYCSFIDLFGWTVSNRLVCCISSL